MQVNPLSASLTTFSSTNSVPDKSTASQTSTSVPSLMNEKGTNTSQVSSDMEVTEVQITRIDQEWLLDRNWGWKSVGSELARNYSLEWGDSDGIPYEALNKFYSFNLNDKNYQNYVSAAMTSGDDLETFLNTAATLYYGDISGSEEALSGFLDFSAQLSQEELSHFLTALEENPHELNNIMDMASKMEKEARGAYLQAASFAGKELEQFNHFVSEMILEQDDSKQLTTWMTAAAQSDEQVMDFLVATVNLSEEARNRVATHIVGRLEEDSEKHFIRFIQSAEEKDINALLDVSERLNQEDMTHLMAAGAEAQYHSGEFVEKLTNVSKNRPGQMSDFLAAASRSGNEMGTFLDRIATLDLEFAGSLSHVDMVNYLKAVANTDITGERHAIAELGKQLTDREDLSNFLYAASMPPSGMDAFLSQVDQLENHEELSAFILKSANKSSKETEQGIYMKGILSEDQYADFQASIEASPINETFLRDMVEMTGELDKESRSRFLDAAASSGAEAQEFTALFDRLSYEKREDLLEITSKLDDEKQGQFIHEALRAGDSVSKFIDVSKRVQDNAQTTFVFNDFLSALSHTEDRSEHQALIDFVGKLGIGQQRSFLSVAASPNRDITALIELGNKMLAINNHDPLNPFHFVEKFDLIAAGKMLERDLTKEIDYFLAHHMSADDTVSTEEYPHPPGSFVETYA